jgi:hypothetical protein
VPLHVHRDSYRRLRSFSSAFITIQSSSPRTSRVSLAGSVPRFSATVGSVSAVLSRVLGIWGSSSRTIRRTSSNATSLRRDASNGVVPVSSS